MTHEPTEQQFAALVDDPRLGPVVMLNLNRFRARAEYPDGHPDSDVSGREAYERYSEVAIRAVSESGGHILWYTDGEGVAIGDDVDDAWDEVFAVWYPSRAAFLALGEVDGYLEAPVHRSAALAEARIIITAGEAEPALTPLI